ncbi:MAG TPA: carbon storage regulator [Urbifossiella sp.]|jgi:carbon storage regulator|nr:carbon storage regulator [Urbifossiella sp.]
MLVLTRRPGEQIVIAGNIRITVVNIGPGRVKIGIEAPENVRVDRQEIFEKIQQEQASDVLHAVANGATSDEPSPTIIASGDTSAKLHNRIAEELAPAAPVSTPVHTADTTPAQIGQPRVRKPR